MIDDQALLERARGGDQRAFETIYDQYRPAVYKYVFYRTGDVALAEDLTAEVFVQVVKNISTFEYRGRPLLAWIYRIASNLVSGHYRKNGQANLLPLHDGIVDNDADPAQTAQQLLNTRRLAAAMPRLTEPQRQVILLKFIDGLSNAEVGEIMGKTEGSVKSLQHRALAALRRVLDEEVQYEPS